MGLGQATGLQRPSPFTTRPLVPTSPFWAHGNLLSSKSPPHSTGLPPPPGQSGSECIATLLGLSAPRPCGWSRGDSPNPKGGSRYQAPDRPLFRPLFQTQTATRLECPAFVPGGPTMQPPSRPRPAWVCAPDSLMSPQPAGSALPFPVPGQLQPGPSHVVLGLPLKGSSPCSPQPPRSSLGSSLSRPRLCRTSLQDTTKTHPSTPA